MARARTAIAWPILPRPDDAQRLAAQLDAGELRALPLAAAHRGVGGRGLAGEPEQQRERVLGGGDRVAGGGVDDGDAGPRRRLEVDVVDADAGAADDDEAGARGDQLGVDLDLAADDEGVVLGQDRGDLLAREAELLVDVVVARRSSRPSAARGSTTRILTRAPPPRGAGEERPLGGGDGRARRDGEAAARWRPPRARRSRPGCRPS